MATYSPVVTCDEELSSYSEDWTTQGLVAVVSLRCLWGVRHDLVDDLLSNARVWPHGGLVNPPTANKAVINPFPTGKTSTGQSINYDHAVITVTYNHESRDLESDSLEPTAEFITQDHRRFRWGASNGDPLAQAEAPGKLRRGLNLVRTQFQVTPPLSAQLLTAVGGVNNAPYTSTPLGMTFAIGTLLFTPPNLSITIKTDGSDGFTVAMKFMYRPETWNKYWRSKTEAYEAIFDVNGGVHNSYPLVDMTDLL